MLRRACLRDGAQFRQARQTGGPFACRDRMAYVARARSLMFSCALTSLLAAGAAPAANAQSAATSREDASADQTGRAGDAAVPGGHGHIESSSVAEDATTRDEPPARAVTPPRLDSAVTAPPSRARTRLLLTLEATFIGLQALDTATTLRALDRGLIEGNGIMRGVTNHPGAFIAVKSATTVGIVLLGRKLSERHHLASIVLMSAIDGAMSLVVARTVALTSGYRR
jgi:hypothetical protein